jgi:single-strand DNA-binding protein
MENKEVLKKENKDMSSFCKVTVIGYLGQDPEMKYSQAGTAICNFSVAHTEKYKDKEETIWFKVTAFGKLAEICGEYLSKGKQVFLEGKLKTEEWQDKNTGKDRYKLVIIASNVVFLGGKNEGGYNQSPSREIVQPVAAVQPTPPTTAGVGDDDIPF